MNHKLKIKHLNSFYLVLSTGCTWNKYEILNNIDIVWWDIVINVVNCKKSILLINLFIKYFYLISKYVFIMQIQIQFFVFFFKFFSLQVNTNYQINHIIYYSNIPTSIILLDMVKLE